MSELGKLLKTTREEKGLSLHDIQTVTKIQKRYLEAIEKGNFSVLPGHFYVRAFIKSYAEAVGLRPEELFHEYQNELPEQQTAEKVATVQRQNKPARLPLRPGKWLSHVLLYSFIILILFVIYIAVSNSDLLTSDDPNQTQDEQNVPDIPDVDGDPTGPPQDGPGPEGENDDKEQEPEPAPLAELSFVKQEGVNYFYEITNVDSIQLSVSSARSISWTEIREGENGRVVYSKTMKMGESTTVDLLKQVYIATGNGPALDITVNDQTLDTSILKGQARQNIYIQMK